MTIPGITIQTGQWYKFNKTEDRQEFLDIVLAAGAKFWWTEKLDAMYYKVDRDEEQIWWIRYRSKFNDKECSRAITYMPKTKPTNDSAFIEAYNNSPFVKSLEPELLVKNKNKILEEQKMVRTIAKAKEEALASLREAYEQELNKFYLETVAYIEVSKATKVIKEYLNKNKKRTPAWESNYVTYAIIDNLLSDDDIINNLLSDDELITKEKINENFRKANQELDHKFIELQELFAITETYEQKVALLKQYCVLKAY